MGILGDSRPMASEDIDAQNLALTIPWIRSDRVVLIGCIAGSAEVWVRKALEMATPDALEEGWWVASAGMRTRGEA